jgi:DNA-binding NarL/FixJ family response regulator
VKTIRLAVVDDHALFRAGLVNLLNGMPDFQVVGEAESGLAALRIIPGKQPDVILLDVNMPGMNGIEVVSTLKKMGEYRILMLTISKNEEDLLGAIQAGADGYILKNAEPDELKKAIDLVYQGQAVLSPEVTRHVLRVVNRQERGMPDESNLSAREIDVLNCLADGKTTTQIAADLVISENTVKTHIRHILEKLDASNRTEAVRKAVQAGVIKQRP